MTRDPRSIFATEPKLLAELGLADGAIVTMDALHCQKNELGSAARL
jgi:predicted transposase YbfD/YdcC